jgi:hypothetical protein
MPAFLGGFVRIAPSETYEKIYKIIMSYKCSSSSTNKIGTTHTIID